MGILDIFSAEKRRVRRLNSAIKSANNKYKPREYRQIALQEVIDEGKRGNEAAIAGLVARFAVNADPSIEDEKEKEWVCEALVDAGRAALPHIRRALRSAESVNWVHRTLKQIIAPEEFKAELIDVLTEFDTEYERNPDRKAQTIMALAEVPGRDVVEALMRFLQDVDETVRFHTVAALAKQADEVAREPLLDVLCNDESLRVRNGVIEAFATLEWSTAGFKKKIETLLPKGFKHEKTGKIVKLGTTA